MSAPTDPARDAVRKRRHLSAVPPGLPTGDGHPDDAAAKTRIQGDWDEAESLDALHPTREEIPTDFEVAYDWRTYPMYVGRLYVVGGASEDDGGPYPSLHRINIRVEGGCVGYGDRILDGYVACLIAHLLNNRTEQDDEVAYEKFSRWCEALEREAR